ncbi:Linear gramicidin synthase subunit D [Fulvia fulva]|uniref:Linear gramicidin synthase subunit D n=1 Tax=Passalora fulva TaxID=5499 RepID=A0A9Q8UWJ2_PASFU|nr:Linear gramicidin synthase subunit D [Fulvia fulva]KAK4609105.1 Linear gramicidin synthase subunit D [Fulvia fulva]KAK4609716.1 Linear gramicidin synthase subunit D [Fulvia fulva]UJO25045.1 Linear gramicidin synthase subunit D [Fulvia fulva]WPV22802.1 Linear gramicidin synthase subunit D [Fulvia fulva]WPV37854.1 Linear gramicidin synthase subunit D [Fulvia fulva]
MSVIDTSKDLCALFSTQVARTPNAVALEDEAETYTYKQLAHKVDELAERLRKHHIKRDSLVGVLLPRSADYVIACLASLQAGGAFLVLELAYPPDLLVDVLEDATPAVIITNSSATGKIKDGTPTIVLDEARDQPNGLSNGDRATNGDHDTNGTQNENGYTNGHTTGVGTDENDLERLAFVAYSSGTTGKPKGIANPHRAAVLSYDLRFRVSDSQPGDRVACNVFFVWEILRPLLRGATVIAVPDEVSYDPVALVDLLATKKTTETLMTPTLLAAVLARFPDIESRLADLRTLWLNGEVVTADLARRASKALPKVRLLNVYSACETHEIACGDVRELLDDEATYCPVGRPLEPEYVHVLDEEGNEVEAGTSGELYVGGDLLARGYLNRPEVTASAFLPDRFNEKDPEARLYRTGDLAILHSSGVLEITGRTGSMIKLRGYSVVPAKVEDTITKHLSVRHCAVVSHGDGLDRQLVVYFVRDDEISGRPQVETDDHGHSPSARKVVSDYLAQYMIPTLWVEMDELPTNSVSGKVDLKSLPPPPMPSTTNGTSTPEDPIRLNDIAEVWAATLGISQATLKPEHSFFDLGGHSLSLAALASKLSRRFGIRVPVGRLAEPADLQSHLLTVREVRDGTIAAVQSDLPAALRKDSSLDRDIEPNGAKICALKDAKTILLTGATGFLGAFLLNELLEGTSAQITCLVRSQEPSDEDKPGCTARLRKNLIDLGLWRDSIMERVEIIPGDLPRKRLGLSTDVFADLAGRVQVIVHAAAQVNLVYPYAALRGSNVDGTREILRLACLGGATVQYVSTNGVLPPSESGHGWPEDSMLYVDAVPEKIPDGYGQTKWAAEQLVLEAGRRGLPVRILRAGTISGHSSSGSANAWDLLTALFVESIHLGFYPDVPGWRAEMTPVDFVSKAIVHLGNQTHAKQLVFHLGDPDPVETKTVFQHFTELGYPTEPLAFDEWVQLWHDRRGTAKGGDGAFTIDILRSGMPSVNFLRDIVVLNNAQTRPFRAIVERPKVDGVLLETYARHWFARGWMNKPPSRHTALGGSALSVKRSILSGRVAVITGASSGIGAAVAVALAQEGCHLVLAARRTDALESLKRRLVVREGKVITKRTDVTSKADVDDLFATTVRELGPVDILVSCAGVMYFTTMAAAHTDEWNTTVDVNCKGLLHCLAATVPAMLARYTTHSIPSHIIAISSDAGRKVFPGLGVYSASKFFVEATLQALRLETAGKGLRVTGVQPGNTQTDLLGMSSDQEAVKAYGMPSGAKILEPADVAGAIVFALKQPEHVAVNEVLIEPRDEPI